MFVFDKYQKFAFLFRDILPLWQWQVSQCIRYWKFNPKYHQNSFCLVRGDKMSCKKVRRDKFNFLWKWYNQLLFSLIRGEHVHRNEKRKMISYYTPVRNRRTSPHLTGVSELIRLLTPKYSGITRSITSCVSNVLATLLWTVWENWSLSSTRILMTCHNSMCGMKNINLLMSYTISSSWHALVKARSLSNLSESLSPLHIASSIRIKGGH